MQDWCYGSYSLSCITAGSLCFSGDPSALSFLKGWYRKDTNDLEGSYILQGQCVCSQNGEVLTLDQSVEQQISKVKEAEKEETLFDRECREQREALEVHTR